MARKSIRASEDLSHSPDADNGIEAMLLAAQERGDESLQTGRFLITYRGDSLDSAPRSLRAQNLRTADARDFAEQSFDVADVGDADAVFLPEIGVAIVSAPAASERNMGVEEIGPADGAVQIVEPEYFVFAENGGDYMRGFLRAASVLAQEFPGSSIEIDDEESAIQSLGSTWGLGACRVPASSRSGQGIRVAVLDTGMDLGHPDFAGRNIVSNTFVGQPPQDLHGHGTHCIGTSCGPLSPPGTTPRYGIAHRAQIFVGKVLTNSGSGISGSVLAGMNWAIANRCSVISMSLGSQSPVQAAYTAAGAAALKNGLLIVAAAGNAASPTGSPANSPTILSVASLDPSLLPSSFSNFGKVEIAAPGRDVFSSVPRPTRYGVKSGTSMATPHVAGCAALWAESDPSLRGQALWNRLRSSARKLTSPASRVGAGLVQAP